MAKTKKLSFGEVSAFCVNLAMIVKSGMSLQDGLDFMARDAENNDEREILTQLQKSITAGQPLSSALFESDRFPAYMVRMIKVSEASGRMDEVLESLGEYYENSRALSKSIKSAVTYPAVMVVMMLTVIFILIAKVLPIFEQVFLQLGADMSAFAQSLLHLGGKLGLYAAVFGCILVLLAVIYCILRATKSGRKFLSRLYEIFFKNISAKTAALRFAYAMSLTLSSGLPTEDALDLASQLEDSERVREKISEMKKHVADGQDFSQALAASGIFSHTYANMIAVGYKTGSVDGMMKKVAQRYEEEVDTRIANLISIVEPTLVAILSIIVGMILLSVMFPLIGIMSAIS